MVHTAKFYLQLEDKEITNLENRYKQNISLIGGALNKQCEAITTAFTYRFFKWYMFITVDFIKLIGKAQITEEDYGQVEYNLNKFLNPLLGISVGELTLIRIDYRCDVKVNNKTEREALIHIYRYRTQEKFRFKKKNHTKYKTSVYFNSKSMQVILYDKEAEKINKSQDIKDFEENVLRYEVRLQNKHLNYMKRQYKIEKTLSNYFKDTLYYKYIRQNLKHFLYRGDYHKIYVAEKIINSCALADKDKIFLREFLVDVSKNSISGAKLRYSQYKFEKAIKLLEELNINPLLISKNFKAPSIIKNPFYID